MICLLGRITIQCMGPAHPGGADVLRPYIIYATHFLKSARTDLDIGTPMQDSPSERKPLLDPRVAGLVERLRQAGRRSAWVAFLNLCTLSVVVALALFCTLQLLHALLGSLAPWMEFATFPVPAWLGAWRSAPLPQHLMISVDFGLVAVAVAALIAATRRAPVDSMARAADRRFGMAESISTAIEVASTDMRPSGVVGEALLKGAQASVGAIDAQRLVPARLPRSSVGVPALLLLAALLAVAPPPPLLQEAFGALRFGAGQDLGLTDQERAEGAGLLMAIAAILKQDGEQRADPELQALAHQIDLLGKQLAGDPKMGREALAEDLDRLLAAVNDVYVRAGEEQNGPQNFGRLVGQAIADIAPKLLTKVQIAARRQEQAGWNTPDNPFTGILTNREEAGKDDFADMVPPAQALGDPRGNGAAGDGTVDALADGIARRDDADDYGEFGPDGAGGGAGELVGGADGEGPGDYAGVGTRALFGALAGRVGLGFDAEMMLQNPPLGGGRRTRFNLPPQTEVVILAEGDLAAGGVWRAVPEHEVTRALVPATARDVVSRYFQALMAERRK